MVLSKKHSSQDVIFGVTITENEAPSGEIMFVTEQPTIAMVPFRVSFNQSNSVEDALRAVQAIATSITPYATFGLRHIQELGPEPAAACRFQNVLRIEPRKSVSVSRTLCHTCDDVGAYPLCIDCHVGDGMITIHGRCDPRVIDTARVYSLLRQLGHVITEIMMGIKRPISHINMLDSYSLQQLHTWNAEPPATVETTIHGLISEHVVTQPDAMAVSSWDGNFSYADVAILSGRLAESLVSNGVGPGVFVPIYLEKSKWAPIAMVGVMRAGGAFVLMDASSPIQRVRQMCTQLDAQVMLSSTSLGVAASGLVPTVLYPEKLDLEPFDKHTEALESNIVKPSDPVFVVFTSGSTGTPKGVVIEHAAMATSLAAFCKRIDINRNTRTLQFASYSFDVSVNDHLAPLVAGGCVCIPSETQRLNGIHTAIQTMQANTMDMTPSMARVLHPEQVPSIHTVILGGESVTPENLAIWGSVKLVEVYGPAECSVTSSIRVGLKPGDDPSNIGWASGGTFWVVEPDNHDRLVPLGTIGELCIGGPIVARGYLNNDQLTRELFISNPAWMAGFPSQAVSTRVYKTGDLVRYFPDGSMQYIGRKDAQVKVRGQRIELAEIEYHLKKNLKCVNQVVVEQIVTGDDVPRCELVVFVQRVTCADGTDELLQELPANPDSPFLIPNVSFREEISDVQRRLEEHLPRAMIPMVFIPVSDVPLSVSGKVDRKRLRNQAASLRRHDLEYYMVSETQKRSPTSASESLVRSMCASVLNTTEDNIGMDDSFFQHGGDSIAAIRLAGAANDCGYMIQVADILHDPCLSSIAKRLQPISNPGATDIQPYSLLEDHTKTSRLLALSESQCGISRNQVEDIYPATALQQGLLSLSARQKGAYVAHIPLKLEKATDLARFQRAWGDAVDANSIIRTRLVQSEGGKLYQVVLHPKQDFIYHRKSLKKYLAEQNEVQFSPGSPLSYGAVVLDNEAGTRYFVITLHHSIYDGWSLPILMQDLQAAYQGTQLRFRGFAGFMAHLAQRDTEFSNEFWRNEFQDLNCSHFPNLPSDSYTPSATETIEHVLNDVPTSSSRSDFTTSTILRFAWASVLSTYMDAEDVVFGVVVTGRSLPVPGILDMTGPTIATVPFRVQLNQEERCSAALSSIQNKGIQIIPFEQDGLLQIRKSCPEAALACGFQSLLVVQAESQELPASDIFSLLPTEDAADWTESTYGINVVCEIESSSIRFIMTYDPRLVDAQIMEMIIYQLAYVTKRLLEDQNGSLCVGDLKEICPEGVPWLCDWNKHVPEAENYCVHDMILSHCRQKPDALAVSAWDGSLTYGDLDRISMSLACCLHARVGPEVRIPILMEKSVWVPIAILAIMRAGGTFVLLEPSLPFDRLMYLCGSIGASLAVASSQHAELARKLLPEVVVVSQESPSPWDGPVVELPPSQPQQALYVIFTSGSTGMPKAVVIEHFSFCTSAKAFAQITRLDTSTRVFQFASYAFDVSISDHLVPLMNGACLCIPSSYQVKDDLTGSIAALKATWADLTPSVARMLDPQQVPTLRTLNLGGEGMIKADIDKWHGLLHLVNVYGPAECSCTTVVQAPMKHDSYPQDIGYGTGCVCWVVDPTDYNRLLPVGAIGELLIEGPIVARGYLDASAEASAAFVKHVRWLGDFRHSADTPRRMYATGDLVQYHSDGSLRYVGRKDKQVKLRGQRLELGEIEHHVQRVFSGIQQCAVELVQPRDSATGPVLAAFLQSPSQYDSEGETRVVKEDITFQKRVQAAQAGLQDALPGFMVPTAFVTLNHIPLSPSAKIDRKRLRNFAAGLLLQELSPYTVSNRCKRYPTTVVETTLCEAFGGVLNRDLKDIGIEDSFFDLGGDSITVMQLVAQCRKRGFKMSTQDVFLHRTVAQIAMHVNASAVDRTEQKDYGFDASFVEKIRTLTVREDENESLLPLSPIQSMFFDNQPRPFDQFNQSLLLKLVRPISREGIVRAIEAVVKRHSMLRSRFRRQDGKWGYIITSNISQSYRYEFQASVESAEMEAEMGRSQLSLDIIRGPLVSFNQFELSGENFLFLITHHLVMDPVSYRIVVSDLETILRDSGPLAPCPLEFPVWNGLQSGYAQTELSPLSTLSSPDDAAQAQASYAEFWGLGDQPSTWGDIQVLNFQLDPKTTKTLLGAANQAFDTQPIELFHAAILHAFTQVFPDRPAPIVWNAAHGREPWDPNLDLSQTVGWFTTIWPAVVHIDRQQHQGQQTPTLTQIIQSTKNARRAIPNNGWAYFTARHFHPEGYCLKPNGPIEIVLNFHGLNQQLDRGDALFQAVPNHHRHDDLHPEARQFELFEVVISGTQGELEFQLEYNSRVRHLDRVKKWFFSCREVLVHMAEELKGEDHS